MISLFKLELVLLKKSRKTKTIKMRDDSSSSGDISAICGFVRAQSTSQML